MQIFFLPIPGSIADYSNLKKKLLARLLLHRGDRDLPDVFYYWRPLLAGGTAFHNRGILAFGAALVLYNGFLNEITTEDQRDKVSSRGFAYGYLGGGLLLALNFLLVLNAGRLGLSTSLAVRLSLLSAGLWWGGFALITFARLKSRAAEKTLPSGKSYLTVGFQELDRTFRELAPIPSTLRYLIGYLFFNDGIQTVIRHGFGIPFPGTLQGQGHTHGPIVSARNFSAGAVCRNFFPRLNF